MEKNDLIFALDIGTRTIIGVVGFYEDDKFKVVDMEVVEHKSRAMIDGQVHDIEAVADSVGILKDNLEKRLGIMLDRVSIAAAGRSLKTSQVHVERLVDSKREIDINTVGSLEIEGIRAAQAEFEEKASKDVDTVYYCVGYTVINYYLNDFIISSLIGHKGKTIGADVLATFLPHTVVDSLYSVMNRVGLKVNSLTLEPIAAINIAIPKNIRLLNLALVDIGAGTSDIAITQNGSVVAYAMVPLAGDEITEVICQRYLLDFNTGEKVKIAITDSKNEISFEDIIGITHTERVEVLKELIEPWVKRLGDTITEKILEYNKKSPSAVFLVGGGSQAFGLSHIIAENLKLPKERVAVRKIDSVQNVEMRDKDKAGPEYITPLGIALNSSEKVGHDFLSVTVNGNRVKLFNVKQQTVGDALLFAEISPAELIPKRGNSLSFILNGEEKIINGEYGRAAEIYINGRPGSIQTLLDPGDEIEVKAAARGPNASITAGDIIEYYDGEVDAVIVNGNIAGFDYSIREGDRIEVKKKDEFQIGEKTLDDILEEEIEAIEAADQAAVDMDYKTESNSNSITVIVNGEQVLLQGSQSNFIFIDIFNHVKFDFSGNRGSVVLKLNGNKAAYTDIINDMDVIEIYWEK